MSNISLILFLIWLLSFVMCGVGFAKSGIEATLIPISCTSLPIINFIMAIYLWYKIAKKNSYKFGDSIRKFRDSIRKFISDLKEL